MKKILLVSHGTMAEGVCKAAKMIVGNNAYLDYQCLSEGMGIDFFRSCVSKKLMELQTAEQLIVIADLQGGSPFTTTLDVLSEQGLLEKTFVIVGMNLILVLELLLAEGDLSEEEIKSYIESARNGLQLFEMRPNDDEEDDL